MSDMLTLAAALDRHTKALETCAAALGAQGIEPKTRKTRTTETAAAPTAEPVAVVPTIATTAVVPAVPTAPAATAAVATPAASAPASAASAANSSGPTLQKVADAIIDLANTVSREKAVEVLTRYGAQKVPQIKSQDFAAVLADVATLKSGGSLSAPASAGLM